MTMHEDPSEKHTTADEESIPTITLFVYGTLKRGHWNHDRFCRNAVDITYDHSLRLMVGAT